MFVSFTITNLCDCAKTYNRIATFGTKRLSQKLKENIIHEKGHISFQNSSHGRCSLNENAINDDVMVNTNH